MPAIKPFDLKTWDGFSELPKEGLDYLLDTTDINKKLADVRDSPYRWRVGTFQVPRELQGAGLERACNQAGKQFIEAFVKQGWTLASKLQFYPGQKFAYDLASGTVMLDKKEMRVRAIFKTNPKPMRIELPPSSVRQDSEQKATLQEVMKGEGISAVPINKRPKK